MDIEAAVSCPLVLNLSAPFLCLSVPVFLAFFLKRRKRETDDVQLAVVALVQTAQGKKPPPNNEQTFVAKQKCVHEQKKNNIPLLDVTRNKLMKMNYVSCLSSSLSQPSQLLKPRAQTQGLY